ncbi:MAG: helix-turn-helix domain-containing protein [Gemmatimonadales bacterium]|nr:helix-turn-helix domain-containing protein [Gemmatimonadales bacterium]
MTPGLREALRIAAEAGVGLTLPPELAIALLAGSSDAAAPPAAQGADVTIADLATRFGRSPSTVRGWLEHGRFPGAYRFRSREWRIPPAGLDAFEKQERSRAQAGSEPTRPARSRPADLSAWRRAG